MNRKLRVDYSHDGGEEDAAPAGYQAQPQLPPNGLSLPVSGASGLLPPLPPGVDLAANISCPDAISRTLGTLPASQLLDIISQMKGLVMTEPSKALELLNQAPQLSYAIFQALLLMGLVDTSALQNVVEHGGPQAPAPPPPPQQYQQYPPNAGGMVVPTPPLPANFRGPHPPPLPPPPHVAQQALPLDSAQLIQQVMSLTPQMINSMSEPERSQIMALRQQFMSAGAGH
jgi:cleavage stimulation factor subunit 2